MVYKHKGTPDRYVRRDSMIWARRNIFKYEVKNENARVRRKTRDELRRVAYDEHFDFFIPKQTTY